MAKLAQTSVKYVIEIEFDAEGIVEKPDVIGAIFGQTEGILGPELDLRELQRTGRIGRIEVEINTAKGKSKGTIDLPSSLDSTETALIAATVETIERVGPCDASMRIKSIKDMRFVKREYIVDRAKTLLTNLIQEMPDINILSEDLRRSVRSQEVTTYKGLPAGPDVAASEAIVVCEGRADVINLLKCGIKNAVAVGGTSAPEQITDISKEKEITVFLDGDRGGDLILKELKQVAEIDFVARAPEGKEVEELTCKEIHKSLRERVPLDQAKDIKSLRYYEAPQEHAGKVARFEASGKDIARAHELVSEVKEGNDKVQVTTRTYTQTQHQQKKVTPVIYKKADREKTPQEQYQGVQSPAKSESDSDNETREFFKKQVNDLVGTKAASIFGKNKTFSGRVPIKELDKALRQIEEPFAIILDSTIDRNTCALAEKVGAKHLIGMGIDQGVFSRKTKILKSSDFQ